MLRVTGPLGAVSNIFFLNTIFESVRDLVITVMVVVEVAILVVAVR